MVEVIRSRSLVSFRIFATGLDPDEITKSLGLVPDHKHHTGDHIRGNPERPQYKHGMWSISSTLQPEALFEEHLDDLLRRLEPKTSEIKYLSSQVTVDFFCSLFDQNGFQLSPSILARIAGLGAMFGVDIYSADPNES
jgi:Domain of unknown function (DUF4279)